MRILLAIALLLTVTAASAQPAPVRPRLLVGSPETHTQVELTQDRCYQWGVPVVARDGNIIAITQTIRTSASCPNPGIDLRRVDLGQLEAGTYRLTYAATPTGGPAIAPHVREFVVHGSSTVRNLRVQPALPTALEPVQATFTTTSCDTVSGVRLVEGGVEIDVETDFSNPVACDVLSVTVVDIGAFPPGTFTLSLAGDVPASSTTFTVAAAPVINHGPDDLSGIWSSPDEDPGTALVFVDSRQQAGNGTPTRALIGTWYRYDDDGNPVWYLVVMDQDLPRFTSHFTGTVHAYEATNPNAPAFQRAITSEAVGEVVIDVNDYVMTARVTGNLHGENFDFVIQPFRYTRSVGFSGD